MNYSLAVFLVVLALVIGWVWGYIEGRDQR